MECWYKLIECLKIPWPLVFYFFPLISRSTLPSADTGPRSEIKQFPPAEAHHYMREKFEVKFLSRVNSSATKGIERKDLQSIPDAGSNNNSISRLTPGPSTSPNPNPNPISKAPPYRRPVKEPIWLKEQQILDVHYFGILAGTFTLEVLPFKSINSRKVYHIRGMAESSALFSIFYRVNDKIETFFDFNGFYSHRFHLVMKETKQTRDALEINDSEGRQSFYWNRWQHQNRGYAESKEYVPITPFSQDSLSGLYYLRAVPLPNGAIITFPVINEGSSWEAVVRVLKREMMDTPLGPRKCVVLKPEARFRGVLQKSGESLIWLTDDDRRFLVRLEAKIKIGTVVGSLQKVRLGIPPSD